MYKQLVHIGIERGIFSYRDGMKCNIVFFDVRYLLIRRMDVIRPRSSLLLWWGSLFMHKDF